MENFKYILSLIIVIVLFALAGYWAFSTIESGSSHVDNQKQKELVEKNKDLEKELASLKRQVALLETETQPEETVTETKTNTPLVPTSTNTTVSKNQDLISALEKMVSANVYLKNKSQGPNVGTVQKFLNIYNNTSNKIDNDYGVSTATAVKNFQKAEGLTVDGEAGPGTFKKMITWLKNH
ncbi:MAG: peptidoglycan-binding protein [Candidatus Paceibacterota bacterium]|jgi:murein L,D-transpeptidase YcbB/YkuD